MPPPTIATAREDRSADGRHFGKIQKEKEEEIGIVRGQKINGNTLRNDVNVHGQTGIWNAVGLRIASHKWIVFPQ